MQTHFFKIKDRGSSERDNETKKTNKPSGACESVSELICVLPYELNARKQAV
jgi:hypothetical protein